MNIWNQAPLVRLILPFIAGIIAAIYFPFNYTYSLLIIFFLLAIIGLIVSIPKFYISYKKSWWFGILIYVALFVSAYQLTINNTITFQPNYFARDGRIDSCSFYHCKILESIQEKEKSVKAIVNIKSIEHNGKWETCSGKAIVYFKKDARSLQLNYGDELLVKAEMKEVQPPQNPSQFNYKEFLRFHNIQHQAYVKPSNWVFTGINSSNIFVSTSLRLRNSLLDVLKQFGVNDDELAVGAALLLGYEDKLDADIISAYSSTGAMHVLSVSGLHVGIIFIVFNWLLLFFDKIKHGNIIKAVILIFLLWFYAALTGLSPSVLRAASMFSFIVIAKSFNRYTNIYNTLTASAFLLLALNPFIIMEVGFQLSYLAVIGIVFIQPKINSWLDFDNKILINIWSITTVSIAAQIATFPLGLHYFHQFPNYFLLSNLIVIPISTLIIYFGIGVFSFSKIPALAKYIAIAFIGLISFLNISVKYIEKLPFALLQGISISVFETWLVYGMIILFLFYFTKHKYVYLISSFVVLSFFLLMQIGEQQKEFYQKKIVVYNINKTSAIDFIDSKQNVLYTDSTLANNQSSLLFNVKHNWWNLGVNNSNIVTSDFTSKHLMIKNKFIQFFNKRIAILDNKTPSELNNFERKLKVDYLLISNNSAVKMKDVLKFYEPKEIIFDSSNSSYRLNKCKKECAALNQKYYSVIDSGALVIDL